MAREIKFRAFSDKSGMWSWERLTTERGGHPLTCLYSHDGWQVMQYTGLKDNNAVEIYEGDVLKHVGSVGDEETRFPFVTFEYGCFRYEYRDWQGKGLTGLPLGDSTPFLQVIGNIYENPELLEAVNA